MATTPWRAYRAEAVLRGKQLTEASAAAAADAELRDAKTRQQNAYKVELGKRTLIRALLEAQAMESS